MYGNLLNFGLLECVVSETVKGRGEGRGPFILVVREVGGEF